MKRKIFDFLLHFSQKKTIAMLCITAGCFLVFILIREKYTISMWTSIGISIFLLWFGATIPFLSLFAKLIESDKPLGIKKKLAILLYVFGFCFIFLGPIILVLFAAGIF